MEQSHASKFELYLCVALVQVKIEYDGNKGYKDIDTGWWDGIRLEAINSTRKRNKGGLFVNLVQLPKAIATWADDLSLVLPCCISSQSCRRLADEPCAVTFGTPSVEEEEEVKITMLILTIDCNKGYNYRLRNFLASRNWAFIMKQR